MTKIIAILQFTVPTVLIIAPFLYRRKFRPLVRFCISMALREKVRKAYTHDFSPLQEDGPSFVDQVYSKAYVRHLFHAEEYLALQIASIHNLAFYLWLVGEARKHILEGDFKPWKEEMLRAVTTRL